MDNSDASPPRLLAEARRRQILELIEKTETVRVDELADSFAVSSVTIRGDLQALSQAGLLVRAHGGALRRHADTNNTEIPVDVRETIHHAKKLRIAMRALEYIQPDSTIILDSGTTTLELARQIHASGIKPLTVITNALNIGMELSRCPNVRTIMLGGILRNVSQSLVGPQAENVLTSLGADYAFVGADSIDVEMGLCTADVLEAQLNARMMATAKKSIILADASKFGRRSLSVIAPLEKCELIITDEEIPAGIRSGIEAKGVKLIIAS